MKTLLAQRRAGVLLHPSSLPSAGYTGDFGADARRFIDLIAAAGLQIWQVLPLGPTHSDLCPYQSFSVHAGNPDLIDLQWLVDQDWLTQEQADIGQITPQRKRLALDQASAAFFEQVATAVASPMIAAYTSFLRETEFWLEDYVRFQAFRDAQMHQPWTAWPLGLRDCEPTACNTRAGELASKLSQLRFRQFVFHCQWRELRQYANAHDILLFGDMPIYVHQESADVWAHQSLFNLDETGHPVTVTGVPPDYFSAEGQLWGNPQYNWQLMRDSGFAWWLQRFDSAAQQFDIARVDHFRALEAYWEIPASATSAKQGKWVHAPGRELLSAVRENYPDLCLVAENLGTISAEVETLRHDFALPGMVILQFAFDGNPDNPYLSHQHARGDIVYTGTHDNNTTLGWFESLPDHTRDTVYRYFNNPPVAMPWMLIEQAMASPANTAVVPWQDFLGLGGAHRMNTPGTTVGNWMWRFKWEQIPAGLTGQIRHALTTYDRLPPVKGHATP
ncbi:MAG: 4-alpha-glucanotransferase [Halioglobus sp.]